MLLLLRTLAKHTKTKGKEQLPDGSSRGLEDLETHSKEVEMSEERMEAFLSFLPVVQACVGEEFERKDLWLTFCRWVSRMV